MFAAISNLLHIPYNWLTKLLYLGIMVAIWKLIVGPVQDTIVALANYGLNLTLYQFFPESALIKLEQFFILMVTFKLMVWVARTDKHGLPNEHHRK